MVAFSRYGDTYVTVSSSPFVSQLTPWSSSVSWRRLRRASHDGLHKVHVTQYQPIQSREAILLVEGLLETTQDLELQFRRSVRLIKQLFAMVVNWSFQCGGIHNVVSYIRSSAGPFYQRSRYQKDNSLQCRSYQVHAARKLSS